MADESTQKKQAYTAGREQRPRGRGGFQRGGAQGGRPSRGRKNDSRERQESDAKLLDLARVTRVAAGGRRFRFRAVVISGDKQGRVGVGVAKGSDVAQAVEKATRQAKKKAITVPIVEGTIPHEVEAKFGGSRVLLKPQKGGRGLVAGGPVRIVCEFAGIHNISGKFLSKTHNKLNNALVTIEALKKLKVSKKKDADTSSAENTQGS
ncbi:MAG TPA: 30S ribosomal protein S5 [Candidatus Paceibacterota bacterium]